MDAAAPRRLALVELDRFGGRREWTFREVAAASASVASSLSAVGAGRGDVVLTLVGNRPQWVITMVACFRTGAVALPCNEQLRAKDLQLRLDVARPAAIVADERNREQLSAAAPDCPVLWCDDPALLAAAPAPAAELAPTLPA